MKRLFKWIFLFALISAGVVMAEPATEANVDPESNVLVLSIRPLDAKVSEAIQTTAQSLGGKISFLSILENGGLDLQREIRYGTADTLLRQFKGGTLLLVNSEEKTKSGETVRTEHFLSQPDLIKALEAYGIRVAVVNPIGNDVTRLVQQRMIPTDGTVEKRYASPASAIVGRPADSTELDETLELAKDFIARGKDSQDKFDPTRQTGMVFVNGENPYSADALAEDARKLQKDIEANIPGRRVVTVPLAPIERPKPKGLEDLGKTGHFMHGELANIFARFDNDEANQDWRLSNTIEVLEKKQHHQGTIMVMPAPSDSNINIAVANAGKAEIGNPAFYGSERFQLLLINGMSTERKLIELRKLGNALDVMEPGEDTAALKLGNHLVDAILADLSMEQASALKGKWKSTFSNEAFLRLLPQLRELQRTQFMLVLNEKSTAAKIYARLLAGIEVLGRSHLSLADRLWLNPLNPMRYRSRPAAIASITADTVAHLKKEMFGTVGIRKPEIKSLLSENRADFSSKVADSLAHYEATFGRPLAVQRTFLEPLRRNNLIADTYHDFPRALSEAEWNAAVTAEEEMAANRPRWLTGCAAALADLP